LFSNTEGSGNTANGQGSLNSNTIGLNNTANGAAALGNNATGAHNTATGVSALALNTSGNNNTAVGELAGINVTTADNVICIGAGVGGENVSNSCYIGQIFGATSSGGTAVFINSSGQLGTATSSRRFKDEIKPMNKASEALFSLKPVTFRYKREIEPAGKSQLGLVAEDVEKVNPNLVVHDKDGKPYSVRYDQVNAMLLNEFLKEHKAFLDEQRTVEKLEAIVSRQQEQIEALAVGLEKVTNQIELSRPAPQTVVNNP
jgi:hypothetical protein